MRAYRCVGAFVCVGKCRSYGAQSAFVCVYPGFHIGLCPHSTLGCAGVSPLQGSLSYCAFVVLCSLNVLGCVNGLFRLCFCICLIVIVLFVVLEGLLVRSDNEPQGGDTPA